MGSQLRSGASFISSSFDSDIPGLCDESLQLLARKPSIYKLNLIHLLQEDDGTLIFH